MRWMTWRAISARHYSVVGTGVDGLAGRDAVVSPHAGPCTNMCFNVLLILKLT